jgi:DNA/RNA-binding domain of Phe-tRNA-synthetase-like protein
MTFIAAEIAAEFPELRLHELTLAARARHSTPELRERLRALSDRFRGPQVLALRQQPVPWAYRVFFRHIGLDPDEHRTPVEALASPPARRSTTPSRSR